MKKRIEIEFDGADRDCFTDKQIVELNKVLTRAKKIAGLTPKDELEGRIRMNKDKWEAISKIQVPIVPSYYIDGTNGKGISGVDLLGASKAFEVISNMKAK